MLKEKIKIDLMAAVRAGDELTRSTLRMLNAAILNREKDKRYKIAKAEPLFKEEELVEKSQLTDVEIVEVLFSEIKKRQEAAFEFEKGKRLDLSEKEKKEAEMLKKYLPEMAAEEEIRRLAKTAIAETGAKEIRDMGRVMAELVPKLKGRADGSLISKVVKDLLTAGL